MNSANGLLRQVSRLPAGTVKRLDAMVAAVSASTGEDVSRAAIIRAVLDKGLAVAEGDADFGRTVGSAVIKRGRKPGTPATPRVKR